MLLEYGANKKKQNKDGSSPVDIAILEDHKDI